MSSPRKMVRTIREVYGLNSPRALSAMLSVPREKFIDPKYKTYAYDDSAISIGYGQTISQPYTVAFMTDLLFRDSTLPSLRRTNKKEETGNGPENWKVLEIGTGSGYQAAVLAEIVKDVYTVEIVPELAGKAKETLKQLGYSNVHVKSGSGEFGWFEKSPFDAILITAGLDKDIPQELFDQLKLGGVLVVPVGKGRDKVMTRFTKTGKKGKNGFTKEEFGVFHFVPFVKSRK